MFITTYGTERPILCWCAVTVEGDLNLWPFQLKIGIVLPHLLFRVRLYQFWFLFTFYPRDAMLLRSLRQQRVRPSVRLSHVGIVPRRAKAGSWHHWHVHHVIAPWFLLLARWVVEKFYLSLTRTACICSWYQKIPYRSSQTGAICVHVGSEGISLSW